MTNPKNSTPNCLSGVLRRFICTGDLPTHPSPAEQIPEKLNIIKPLNSQNSAINGPQVHIQAQAISPGIVARLMGLDSIPPHKKMTGNESLFRSKSLNSLHFLPNFNPTRPSFHRHSRTSSSFHEQGTNFLVEIEGNLGINGVKMKDFKMGNGDYLEQKEKKREKVVTLKGNECRKNSGRRKYGESRKRIEEGYSSILRKSLDGGSNCSREKNGIRKRKLIKERNLKVSSSVSSKRVYPKEDLYVKLQNDSPSKEDKLRSTSRRKSSQKIKIHNEMPLQNIMPKSKKNDGGSNRIESKDNKLIKTEVEVAEYFVDLLGQICKLSEDHIRDSKWMRKYEVFKVDFVEEMCTNFCQELLDFLLNDLMDELI